MSADIVDLTDTTELVDVVAIRIGYEWRGRQMRYRERFQVPSALAKILHDRYIVAYPDELT